MSNNHTNYLELSLGRPDTSGAVTTFTRKSVDVRNLQETLTSHNYSFIAWNGSRLSENFAEATGFCVDSDEGMTIADGRKKFEALDVNYAQITTRSHTPDAHRYRILIPFNRPVLALTNYKAIVKKLQVSIYHFLNLIYSRPDLAAMFFGLHSHEEIDKNVRAVERTFWLEVQPSTVFLKFRKKPTEAINRSVSSKELVEENNTWRNGLVWIYPYPSERGLVLAAAHLGFRMEPVSPGSRSFYFNMEAKRATYPGNPQTPGTE